MIPTGTDPRIENPDLITDPQGTYATNLRFSYGTYNQPDSYRTGVAACDAITGPCGYNDNEMQGFDSQVRGSNNPQNLQNAGGASFIHSSAQFAEEYMPFAAAPNDSNPPSPRNVYIDKTNSGVLTAGQSISAGSLNQGNDYCMCNPSGSQLRMQTDGNLVIYNSQNTVLWQSNTPGGDANSYAVMQSDGNFVVYDNGVSRFRTGTYGHPGAYIIFQNVDNRLVVRSSADQLLWSAGT